MERYRFNISDGDSFEHVGEGALLISCIKFSANNPSQSPLPEAWTEKARFVDRRQRLHCSPALNKTALQKQQGSE
jgi:hypothetical protein